MAIDFTGASAVRIPEGDVTKITVKDTGVVKWEKTSGRRVGDLAIGSRVRINVDGTTRGWTVVHQGRPNSDVYDETANGTWLLAQRQLTSTVTWGNSGGYASSPVNTQLINTFPGVIPANNLPKIRTVSVPCDVGDNAVAQFFCLSAVELGATPALAGDGVTLDYFVGADNEKRKMNTNAAYHTRTVNGTQKVYIQNTGASRSIASASAAIRPACILYPDTRIDDSDFIIV